MVYSIKTKFQINVKDKEFSQKVLKKKLSSKYGHPTIQYKKLSNRGTQNYFQKSNPKSSRINWLFSWKKHRKGCFKEYWWGLQANRRYLHKQTEYQLEYYYEMSKKKIHITKKNISKLLMNSDHYNYKSVDRLEYQKFIKFLDNTTNDLYIIPKWVNYSNASSGSRCSSTDKGNQQVTFKNWEPFTKCISKINNMQVDNE